MFHRRHNTRQAGKINNPGDLRLRCTDSRDEDARLLTEEARRTGARSSGLQASCLGSHGARSDVTRNWKLPHNYSSSQPASRFSRFLSTYTRVPRILARQNTVINVPRQSRLNDASSVFALLASETPRPCIRKAPLRSRTRHNRHRQIRLRPFPFGLNDGGSLHRSLTTAPCNRCILNASPANEERQVCSR